MARGFSASRGGGREECPPFFYFFFFFLHIRDRLWCRRAPSSHLWLRGLVRRVRRQTTDAEGESEAQPPVLRVVRHHLMNIRREEVSDGEIVIFFYDESRKEENQIKKKSERGKAGCNDDRTFLTTSARS